MSEPPDRLDRRYVASTLAVLALSVVSSLFGLFREGHYDADEWIVLRLQAQDAVILLVVVPILALSLGSARRGSLRGRVVWLAALAYATYAWSSITATTPFGEFFLGYVALFSLSLFTLVGGIVGTDPAPIHGALRGRISRRFYAALLVAIAVGLSALWLPTIVSAGLAGTDPAVVAELGEGAVHTYVLDLGVVVPALVVTAVWLRRGRPWGSVFAGVLLVMAALLAPTLTAITAVDAVGESVTVTTPLLVGTVVPPLVAAAFAGKYLLALESDSSGERDSDAPPKGGQTDDRSERTETDDPAERGVDA